MLTAGIPEGLSFPKFPLSGRVCVSSLSSDGAPLFERSSDMRLQGPRLFSLRVIRDPSGEERNTTYRVCWRSVGVRGRQSLTRIRGLIPGARFFLRVVNLQREPNQGRRAMGKETAGTCRPQPRKSKEHGHGRRWIHAWPATARRTALAQEVPGEIDNPEGRTLCRLSLVVSVVEVVTRGS